MCEIKKTSRIFGVILAIMVGLAAFGALGAPAYGASNSAAAAKAVKKAKIKVKLTAGEAAMTVKWNRVKKAGGYQIYRSTAKKGKYKRIKTVKKASTIKYTNKKLKEGKRYYYKVRAFKKSKGKTVYSKFSKVQSKKTLVKLNTHINSFLKKATKPSMTKEQKLKASYVYMRDHYKYIKRDMVAQSNNNWVNGYAKNFFADKGGNCYSWAAAYTSVAQKLGYPAKACAGTLYHADGKVWGEHAWTEISMGGTAYVFDPEIEYAHKIKGQSMNLYKLPYNNALFIYKER